MTRLTLRNLRGILATCVLRTLFVLTAAAGVADVAGRNLVHAQLGEANVPVLKKDYAADYHPTLKENEKEIQGLVVYGPEAGECVKFEPAGLRITLPKGHPRPRAGTGVVTDFGVKGDFEITVNLEILQEPSAGLPGNPTDLKLIVVPSEAVEPDVWHKANQNRAGLAREAAGRGNSGGFAANSTKWNPDLPRDEWGNENFSKVEVHTKKRILAKAKIGRMRLVRNGPMLYFFKSEGLDQDFVLFHKNEFGTKDLKNVRVLGSTGSPAATFDVRVTDFQIRADAFVKTEPNAPPVVAAPGAERSPWLLPLGVGVPVVLMALALLAFGVVIVRRRASRADEFADAKAEEPAPPSVSSTIEFKCPGCGKRLKARSDRAGSKVKCPQCAAAVVIPKTKPDQVQESES